MPFQTDEDVRPEIGLDQDEQIRANTLDKQTHHRQQVDGPVDDPIGGFAEQVIGNLSAGGGWSPRR